MASSQPPKLFIATKALIEHNGKVLILRESSSYDDGTNTGKYDLPGGRLGAGENFRTALSREVKEETGLKIKIGVPVAVDEWRPVVKGEKWHIVGIFFICNTDSANVVLGPDHDSYVWIDPSDFPQYDLIKNLVSPFKIFNQMKRGKNAAGYLLLK